MPNAPPARSISSMNSAEKIHNIFRIVEKERSIQISIDSLSRGIDNYHIDIRLSKKFSSDIKKLASLLISQTSVPKPKSWDNSERSVARAPNLRERKELL